MNTSTLFRLFAGACTALAVSAALAAPAAVEPPTTWVDKDTGHRVWRLSPEAGAGSLYFNLNAYTPDDKTMVYTAPDGIHVLDMATKATRLLVPGSGREGPRVIAMGRKTNSVFFLREDVATRVTAVYSASTDSGKVSKLVDLPAGMRVDSINADETLAAGTYEEDLKTGAPVVRTPPAPGAPVVAPVSKGVMMENRLASRTPLVLFAINLQTAAVTKLLHSTDWVNHLLFSPTDPTLLMYCHEGPWQKVDRIWTIRTDGSQKTMIHKRTMSMEIAGHEFWGADGKTVWYDWQYPKGATFYVAGLNLDTGARTAYQVERNDWSIHFNVTNDGLLFGGDGGDAGQVAKAPDGQWIVLLRPKSSLVPGAMNEPGYWQGGVMQSERLVNMASHNYHLEPNVRFSPDKKLLIFRTNMFGATYVLGVEVAKAAAGAKDIASTPALNKQFQVALPARPTR
jgi:oligogalacturonide lyase